MEVRLNRRGPDGDSTERLLTLTPQPNSPTTFETTLTQTPEGLYRFELVTPSVTPPPARRMQGDGAAGRDLLSASQSSGAGDGGGGVAWTLLQPGRRGQSAQGTARGHRVDLNSACPALAVVEPYRAVPHRDRVAGVGMVAAEGNESAIIDEVGAAARSIVWRRMLLSTPGRAGGWISEINNGVRSSLEQTAELR